jgi:hypothetical protein
MAMKPVTGKLRKGGGKGLSGDALVGKVSQATIDSIKKMGMTEALKLAGKNNKTSGGMAREFQEGVRRMYGAKRLEAAKATYAPKPKLGAKTVMAPKGGNKPAPKPATKSNTKSNVIKGTLGAAAALGVLAASKGKGAAVAAKLSPAVGKAASSGVGKAIFGTTPKMSPAMMAKYKAAAGPKAAAAKVTVGPKGSFGKTTMQQTKSGKGTPSEYASKAGQSGARATIQSRMSGPDAARAAASYPKTIKSGKSTKTFGEISKNVAKATAAGGGANSGKKKLTTSASNKRK